MLQKVAVHALRNVYNGALDLNQKRSKKTEGMLQILTKLDQKKTGAVVDDANKVTAPTVAEIVKLMEGPIARKVPAFHKAKTKLQEAVNQLQLAVTRQELGVREAKRHRRRTMQDDAQAVEELQRQELRLRLNERLEQRQTRSSNRRLRPTPDDAGEDDVIEARDLSNSSSMHVKTAMIQDQAGPQASDGNAWDFWSKVDRKNEVRRAARQQARKDVAAEEIARGNRAWNTTHYMPSRLEAVKARPGQDGDYVSMLVSARSAEEMHAARTAEAVLFPRYLARRKLAKVDEAAPSGTHTNMAGVEQATGANATQQPQRNTHFALQYLRRRQALAVLEGDAQAQAHVSSAYRP